MSMEAVLRQKLESGLALDHCEVINESHGHNVPKGSETHFKVVLVSPDFSGMRAVARHQKVYGLVSEELKGGVHALALHTYSPEEWLLQGSAPESPACRGGSKHDRGE